jgi:hypothetical protein
MEILARLPKLDFGVCCPSAAQMLSSDRALIGASQAFRERFWVGGRVCGRRPLRVVAASPTASDRRRAGADLPRAVRTPDAGPRARARGTSRLYSSEVPVELFSESDVTFMEAVASVLLDYVPDKSDDLVLGEAGGVQHVAK